MKTGLNWAVALALAAILSQANATRPGCVLNHDGQLSCLASTSRLTSVHQGDEMACPKNDMDCWCMKAVKYTNEVRRRHGVQKGLKVGTESQLDNAVRYAAVLGDIGRLDHQSLSDATQDVGCKRFIGGENIAYNYERFDIAKACVDQWEGSAGHLENIKRERFEEVVVGFHMESDGRVYCVQTFASIESFGTVGSESDRGCEPVPNDSGGGGDDEPKPSSSPSASPKPVRPRRSQDPSPAPSQDPSMAPSQDPSMAPSPDPSMAPSQDPRMTPLPSVAMETMMPSPMETPMDSPMPTPEESMPDMPWPERKKAFKACRCLMRGERCAGMLVTKTGGLCKEGTPASEQPKKCKKHCCMACRMYPTQRKCSSGRVRAICGNR